MIRRLLEWRRRQKAWERYYRDIYRAAADSNRNRKAHQ